MSRVCTAGGREKSMLLGCECRLGRTTLRRRRRHIRNVRRFAITYHVVDLSTITTKTSQKSPLNEFLPEHNKNRLELARPAVWSCQKKITTSGSITVASILTRLHCDVFKCLQSASCQNIAITRIPAAWYRPSVSTFQWSLAGSGIVAEA